MERVVLESFPHNILGIGEATSCLEEVSSRLRLISWRHFFFAVAFRRRPTDERVVDVGCFRSDVTAAAMDTSRRVAPYTT